jgi:hypothetical protein
VERYDSWSGGESDRSIWSDDFVEQALKSLCKSF